MRPSIALVDSECYFVSDSGDNSPNLLYNLLQRQRERTDRKEKMHDRVVPLVFHRRGKAIKQMDGAWKKACAAAGCPGRLFHDLRRTAVRNLERASVPRSVAMKITGHKTEAVYRSS